MPVPFDPMATISFSPGDIPCTVNSHWGLHEMWNMLPSLRYWQVYLANCNKKQRFGTIRSICLAKWNKVQLIFKSWIGINLIGFHMNSRKAYSCDLCLSYLPALCTTVPYFIMSEGPGFRSCSECINFMHYKCHLQHGPSLNTFISH